MGRRPRGWHVTLFWLDSAGKLLTLDQAAAEDSTPRLAYPEARGQSVTVAGAPGTEFLFACGRRSDPMDAAEVAALLDPGPLPSLPPDVLVHVTSDDVQADETGKGPGELREHPDPEGEVLHRLDVLRVALCAKYPLLSGIAFGHR